MSYMYHNELFPDFPRCFSGINPPALSQQHRSLLSLVLAGIRMQIMRNCPPVKLHIYMRVKEGDWESRKCQEWKAIINEKMPRRALLHALTAGEHSDKPRTFIFTGNGADVPFSAMCQSAIMSLSSVIGIRWGQKTGERFVSITFTTHPQNSLSFCLLYGETMTCNTNNYFSTLLISSDTFSREGKRQFSVFSRMSLHGIGVSLLDDCV